MTIDPQSYDYTQHIDAPSFKTDVSAAWSGISEVPYEELTTNEIREHFLMYILGKNSTNGGSASYDRSTVADAYLYPSGEIDPDYNALHSDSIFANLTSSDQALLDIFLTDFDDLDPSVPADRTTLANLQTDLKNLVEGLVRLAEGAEEDVQNTAHPHAGKLTRKMVEGIDLLLLSLVNAGILTTSPLTRVSSGNYSNLASINLADTSVGNQTDANLLLRKFKNWQQTATTKDIVKLLEEAGRNAPTRVNYFNVGETAGGAKMIDTPLTTIEKVESYSGSGPLPDGVVRVMGDVLDTPRALQDMVRFDFVQHGHNLLFDALSDLHDKMKIIDQSLAILNDIQDALNAKDPERASVNLQALFDPDFLRDRIPLLTRMNKKDKNQEADTKDGYIQKIKAWEADQFDRNLATEINLDIDQDSHDVFDHRNSLHRDYWQSKADNFTQLDVTSGKWLQYTDASGFQKAIKIGDPSATGLGSQFLGALDASATFGGAPSGVSQGSMLNFFDTVINNLLANNILNDGDLSESDLAARMAQLRNDFAGATNGTAYIEDYNDSFGAAGSPYQKNLEKAMLSAQAMNDVKKEELRRRMFEFEEFMKAASAMMQRITQILERIAQGIRGS